MNSVQPEVAEPGQAMAPRKRRRRWAVRAAKAAAVLACLAVVALLWLMTVGLPRPARSWLLERAAAGPLAVELAAIKLAPSGEILLREVDLYRKGVVGPPLISADRMYLRVDWSAIFDRHRRLVGVRIDRGQYCPHLPPDVDPLGFRAVVPLEAVQFRIEVAADGSIAIRDLAGRLAGIAVAGQGTVAPGRMPPPPPGRRPSSERWLRFLHWLGSIEYTQPPQATVDFRIEPANRARETFSVRAAGMDAWFTNGRLGSWTVVVDIAKQRLDGRLQVDDSTVESVGLDDVDCSFTASPTGVTVTVGHAVVGRGPRRGPGHGSWTYRSADGSYSGHVVAHFDPREILVPVKRRQWRQQRLIESFTFPDEAPNLFVDFSGRGRDDPFCNLVGRLDAVDCTYNGVPARGLYAGFDIRLSPTNRVMRMDPLAIVRDDGSVAASLTQDFIWKTVDFVGESTIAPAALVRLLSPRLPDKLAWLHGEAPARIVAAGVANYRHGGFNDFSFGVAAPRLGVLHFNFDDARAHVSVSGPRIEVSGIDARLYDGACRAEAAFERGEDDVGTRYTIVGAVTDADFTKVVQGVSRGERNGKSYRGRFNGSIDISGLLGRGRAKTARGSGEIAITSGRIMSIPLFGGFTGMLSDVIPGLSSVVRLTEARSDLAIADGIVTSDRIVIEGNVLRLEGKGAYTLEDKALKYKAKVHLFKDDVLIGKLADIVIPPLAKILEFRLTGTLDNPRWKGVNLPIRGGGEK